MILVLHTHDCFSLHIDNIAERYIRDASLYFKCLVFFFDVLSSMNDYHYIINNYTYMYIDVI